MAGGVFELGERDYVMSYHCLNETESYAIGFSFASDPLGPWSEQAVVEAGEFQTEWHTNPELDGVRFYRVRAQRKP